MGSKQQPDEFPTWTSAELHDRGVLNVFCVENALYEAATGWSGQFFAGNKTKKCPMSHRLIKTTGFEIELTKHTVFS